MRGNIFGILALGMLAALLPAMFAFDDTDSLGGGFVDVISSFAGPVIVAMFLVACAALTVAFFSTDGF